MQGLADAFCIDQEKEQVVPSFNDNKSFEFGSHCSLKKRAFPFFNEANDSGENSNLGVSKVKMSKFKKMKIGENDHRSSFESNISVSWNQFEDFFNFLKYRVFSFAINKYHRITLGNTKQSKKLNVAKTSKNTELFFGLCTTYDIKNVKHKTGIATNNEINLSSDNELLISKDQNPQDLGSFVLHENVLFPSKTEKRLSSPTAVGAVLNLNSPLCSLKLYGNKAATEEEGSDLLVSEANEYYNLKPEIHLESLVLPNESSFNSVSKLENLADSPVKDVEIIIQSSPLLFSKDFQISYKEVFEELHVVPSENLFHDDINSTNIESLYLKGSHETSCSLNNKKASLLGNSCLTSKQENTKFPSSSGFSKRSLSKETLDYIISELMSTQGAAPIGCDASRVVKRRISFDHLENSVVPDMKGIQSESLLKAHNAKKAKIVPEGFKPLEQYTSNKRPQDSSDPVPFSHEIFINNIPKCFKTPQKLRLGLSKKRRVPSLHTQYK